MKKFILFSFILAFSQIGFSQSKVQNSLCTSLFRFEKNSQSIYGKLNGKFISGIEYQRSINRWGFGLKYEHGNTKMDEYDDSYRDQVNGIGYLQEDNIYLSSYYSFPRFLNSKIEFYTGLGVYYSNIHYEGTFTGAWGGNPNRDDRYQSIGLAPSFGFKLFPSERLFIALNSNWRLGLSTQNDQIRQRKTKGNEFVYNAAELRVGVVF